MTAPSARGSRVEHARKGSAVGRTASRHGPARSPHAACCRLDSRRPLASQNGNKRELARTPRNVRKRPATATTGRASTRNANKERDMNSPPARVDARAAAERHTIETAQRGRSPGGRRITQAGNPCHGKLIRRQPGPHWRRPGHTQPCQRTRGEKRRRRGRRRKGREGRKSRVWPRLEAREHHLGHPPWDGGAPPPPRVHHHA